MTPSRIAMLLIGILGMQASAAEPINIPTDVQSVLTLRYPRNVDHLRLIQQQVQQVSKQAMPATVGVVVGHGAGSGVIINAEGLVLTAGHVIGKAGRRATLLLPDGRQLIGKTLGVNHEIDAGMVQIENPPADLPFLPVATEMPKVGEWVITTGQPGGIEDDRSPPLRLGRVLGSGEDWICSDCTLVGGDSGGPLINLRGEVLAVHSSIGPEIVHNFHIPVVEIQKGWKRLLAGEVWGDNLEEVVSWEMRPFMGISGQTKAGQCLIDRVFSGLPADEAGVLTGDIIQRIDGVPISSFEEVSKKVMQSRPGQKLRLTIERDGETRTIEVVLAGLRRAVPRKESDESESSEEP